MKNSFQDNETDKMSGLVWDVMMIILSKVKSLRGFLFACFPFSVALNKCLSCASTLPRNINLFGQEELILKQKEKIAFS